ncbi:hypothetical protein CPB86DRAFT_490835 [Serendipita vermifera]|nr:hypothetical protein CPB86DRAFT_490835 [Serendipita vermifera]
MASIQSLPLEIVIDILDLVLSGCSRRTFGEIGHDAAWNMPKPNALDLMMIQPSRPHTPIGETLPFPNEVDLTILQSPRPHTSPGETLPSPSGLDTEMNEISNLRGMSTKYFSPTFGTFNRCTYGQDQNVRKTQIHGMT